MGSWVFTRPCSALDSIPEVYSLVRGSKTRKMQNRLSAWIKLGTSEAPQEVKRCSKRSMSTSDGRPWNERDGWRTKKMVRKTAKDLAVSSNKAILSAAEHPDAGTGWFEVKVESFS